LDLEVIVLIGIIPELIKRNSIIEEEFTLSVSMVISVGNQSNWLTDDFISSLKLLLRVILEGQNGTGLDMTMNNAIVSVGNLKVDVLTIFTVAILVVFRALNIDNVGEVVHRNPLSSREVGADESDI
jgi:hypothetical protein